MTEQEVIDFFAGKLALTPIGFCGEGAFGKVLLANDQLGRLLVLKIVDKAKLGSGWIREFNGLRFYCQNIHDHSHLIAIHHVEDYGDYFCYTMEAADNIYKDEKGQEFYKPDTLENRIVKKQSFTPEELLEIAEDLLAGLKVMHEAGLIHRDVKPANVIFIDGHAKLGDMGLVTNPTETHSFAGTPGFLPPELIAQLDDKTTNDAAGDLYALGKVIYCMLTGLSAKSFPEIPHSLVKSPFARRLNQFLLVACGENRMKRYRTVESFQKALKKVHPSSKDLPLGGYARWMLCGAVALLVLLAASVWMFHGKSTGSTSNGGKTAVVPPEESPSVSQNVDENGGETTPEKTPSPGKDTSSPPAETDGSPDGQTASAPAKEAVQPAEAKDAAPQAKPEPPVPPAAVATQPAVPPRAQHPENKGGAEAQGPAFMPVAEPKHYAVYLHERFQNARNRFTELGYTPERKPTVSVDAIGRNLEDTKANLELYKAALRLKQFDELNAQSTVKRKARELDMTQFDAQRSEVLQKKVSAYIARKLFRRSSYPYDDGLSSQMLAELRSGKINPNMMIEDKFSSDSTLLACTCRELFANSKEIARTLIELGADTTHLHDAANMLLQAETGMLVVCEGGFDNMKGFLLGLLKNNERKIEYPVDDIIEKLIFLNHNLVEQDDLGNTALHYAVQRGSLRLVSLMVCADANPNVQNNKGETPLFNAVRYGYREIEELLRFVGANPSITDKNGKKAEDFRR